MKGDHYRILGVSVSATEEEIRKAYRHKAKTCHPDHHPGDPQKAEEFKRLQAAYEVLMDRDRRAAYDRERAAAAARETGERILDHGLQRGEELIRDAIDLGAQALKARLRRWLLKS